MTTSCHRSREIEHICARSNGVNPTLFRDGIGIPPRTVNLWDGQLYFLQPPKPLCSKDTYTTHVTCIDEGQFSIRVVCTLLSPATYRRRFLIFAERLKAPVIGCVICRLLA